MVIKKSLFLVLSFTLLVSKLQKLAENSAKAYDRARPVMPYKIVYSLPENENNVFLMRTRNFKVICAEQISPQNHFCCQLLLL